MGLCLPLLLALCLAAPSGGAWAGEAADELLCAPSRLGCLTTWLVAGPLRFLRADQFDADLLAKAGGEAKARPRDGQVADAASGLAWQAAVFPRSVHDFRQRCLPLGQSAFYLAAVLVPRKDVELSILVLHTGSARLWVDGRKVLVSDPDPFGMGSRTAAHKLSLRKGKRAHCLLKLGSEARQLQFVVRLMAGRRPVGPDEVVVALPLAQDRGPRVEPHVLSALSLALGGQQEFVEPGRPASVLLGIVGGYPVCRGKVAATITIKDSRGRSVETLKMPPASVPALADRSARLAWTPPKAGGSAYYDLTAEVAFDGHKLGALTRTVYCPRNIGQWTQAVHGRLARLSREGKVSPEQLAHVLLKVEKASALQRNVESFTLAAGDVHRELQVASEWLDRFEKGQGLPALEPGAHELAYLAPQDDSAQPYYLHIPRTYTGRKPIPAIVYLHGYAPWLDKTNWHELSYGLTDLAEEHGYLIICPFARSNTDFQAVGEVDVLEVLRLAHQRVKIDPDRVFLLGYSMGGMGAYTIAPHYPHLWAGVIALCGRAHYYLWHGLDPARVEPFKRHLLDMEFGWPLAPNFRHVPVLAFQGTADTLIKPVQAYRFVDLLRGLGGSAELVRLEGQSHWIADETFSTPKAFQWMERQRRVADPATIRFATHSLRYHRAYWLTIHAFQTWGQPAAVEVTLKPGNRLELTASNVARLSLQPPARRCKPAAPFHATVNGKPMELKPGPKGTLTLTLAKQPDTPLRKTPALCGPIKDAFNTRFLLVYGTAGDAAATRLNRSAAQAMQRDWFRFAKGLPRLVKDSELEPKEIARSNLFLFGTPTTHALLAKIAPKLPIRFTADGYEILGRPYKANATTGLLFIYPNPLAPDRYVVVCSGHHYGSALPPNHKYDLLPDFILYSDAADYDNTNAFYCAGLFDTHWQLSPNLVWTSDGTRQPKPEAALTPAPAPRAPRPEPVPARP